MKHTNTCQRKKTEKKMKENFPNLVNKKDIQVQEAQSPKQDEPK